MSEEYLDKSLDIDILHGIQHLLDLVFGYKSLILFYIRSEVLSLLPRLLIDFILVLPNRNLLDDVPGNEFEEGRVLILLKLKHGLLQSLIHTLSIRLRLVGDRRVYFK